MAIKQELDIFQTRHLYDLLLAQATNDTPNRHLDRMVINQIATMGKTEVAYVREMVTETLKAL